MTEIEGQRERKRDRERERERVRDKERVSERERKRETERGERVREGEGKRSRVVKIKNIRKQNLLYGCFKKQSTQKISNQKMKLKERDKSILEYVQCMYNNVHAYKVPGF